MKQSDVHGQSKLNLQQVSENLQRINTGKSNLWADYLESLSSLAAQPDQQSVKHKFLGLAMLWNLETGHSSAIEVEHWAYQEIISLGEAVVPFLLEGLEKGTGHWFHALGMITGAAPVPPESKGRVPEMTKFWLEWGKINGYRK